jgi:hypothetical protein
MSDERKPVYDISHRDWNVKAFYRGEKDQNADIVITRSGQPFREYEYPAYRIWNIAAHFSDMVENFEAEEANA